MTSRIREAQELQIELRCNSCREVFPEAEAIDDEFCPNCGCDSLFEHVGFHVNEFGEAIPHAITTEIREVKL